MKLSYEVLVNFVANKCTLLICFCTSLYKFADMFRPVWIIIGASHTLNIFTLLVYYTFKSL
jgi:hypothetical protein